MFLSENKNDFRASLPKEWLFFLHTSQAALAAGAAGVRPPNRKQSERRSPVGGLSGLALEVAVGPCVFIPFLFSLKKRGGLGAL